MSDGRGCWCCAAGPFECICEADWTPQEIYDQQKRIAELEPDKIEPRDNILFLRKRIAKLEAAIAQYGQHDMECALNVSMDGLCDCGLAKALKEV